MHFVTFIQYIQFLTNRNTFTNMFAIILIFLKKHFIELLFYYTRLCCWDECFNSTNITTNKKSRLILRYCTNIFKKITSPLRLDVTVQTKANLELKIYGCNILEREHETTSKYSTSRPSIQDLQ